MMAIPKRKSFLAIVYIGLAMEGYFETKGVPVKFKNPLSRDEFTRLYGSTIRGLFNQLWGMNLDVITEARVFEAMRGFDQNILDQVQRNIEVFGNTVYKPGMAQVIGKGADPVIEAINNISDASMFFDITHPSVTNWLNNHTAEKIVGKLFETQGAAIKSVIRTSIDQKLGFLQTKEMLKSGMILTERQTGWVTKRYNKAYDKFLERYSWDGMPNAAGRARDAASRSAARWRKHLLDNRTETITRTELTRAHNVAERAGLMQAEENGYIKNVRRTWRRTSSINNHESSLTNDGVTVGLRERFPSGAEFPDEINEQCILENSFETIKKPGRPGKPIGQIPGVGKPKPKPKPKRKLPSELIGKTDEELERMIKKVKPKLTKEELEMIKFYSTDEGFTQLNNYLRKTKGPFDAFFSPAELAEINAKIQKKVDILRSAFKKLPAYDGTTYRTVNAEADFMKKFGDNFKKGKTLTFDGFTSTSIKKEVAHDFLRRDEEVTSIVFKIKSKTGKYMGSLGWGSEFELVFDNKTSFNVIEIQSKNELLPNKEHMGKYKFLLITLEAIIR